MRRVYVPGRAAGSPAVTLLERHKLLPSQRICEKPRGGPGQNAELFTPTRTSKLGYLYFAACNRKWKRKEKCPQGNTAKRGQCNTLALWREGLNSRRWVRRIGIICAVNLRFTHTQSLWENRKQSHYVFLQQVTGTAESCYCDTSQWITIRNAAVRGDTASSPFHLLWKMSASTSTMFPWILRGRQIMKESLSFYRAAEVSPRFSFVFNIENAHFGFNISQMFISL